MPDHTTLGMNGSRIEVAWQQTRRGRPDNRVRFRGTADLLVQRELELFSFRCAFLNEIRLRHAFFNCTNKPQTILRRPRRQPDPLQRGPRVRDVVAQLLLGTGRRIPCHHIESMSQRACHPATADYACPDCCKCLDIDDHCHC